MSIDTMETDPNPPNSADLSELAMPVETPKVPSPLCSAYPQMGPVHMTTRPATLTWTDQGQILCHGAIQVVIAVSSLRTRSIPSCTKDFDIVSTISDSSSSGTPICTGNLSFIQKARFEAKTVHHQRRHYNNTARDGSGVSYAYEPIRYGSGRR